MESGFEDVGVDGGAVVEGGGFDARLEEGSVDDGFEREGGELEEEMVWVWEGMKKNGLVLL